MHHRNALAHHTDNVCSLRLDLRVQVPVPSKGGRRTEGQLLLAPPHTWDLACLLNSGHPEQGKWEHRPKRVLAVCLGD